MRPTQEQHGLVFEIGVAFVGKRAPRSYQEDPTRRYEIASSVFQTRTLTEDPDELVGPLLSSDKRVSTRHNIAVDMLLETLDEKGGIDLKEDTVTENISREAPHLYKLQ